MDRGQASLEYVVVIGLVAVVLAAGGAAASAAGIPQSIAASVHRALCLVSGGDCLAEGGPRPCVVASDGRSRERKGTLVVATLADGRIVLREDRSDGTVSITVVKDVRGGAEANVGPRLEANGKGLKASVRAGLDLRGGDGERYVVAGAGAADRLMARIANGGDGLPEPEETWLAGGLGANLDATAKAFGAAEAEATGSSVRTIGVRRNHRTGERTVALELTRALDAELSTPLATIAGGLPAATRLEITLDRDERPVRLTAFASRGVHGSAEAGSLRSSGGDRVEVEARLELDAETRSLARDLASPRAAAAARALGRRLASAARVDVRHYATDRDETVKGGSVGLLGKLGYEEVRVHETARLVDAAGFEPGLGWSRRLDCVGVA
jgi:hypothetical protein